MATAEKSATSDERLLNRELSWLAFNGRVLELAEDPSVPLLERVKFCSIFSSNLDEFFMVRVAGLLGQLAAGLSVRSPDGRSPQEALFEIRKLVTELTARQTKLWRRDLKPALADAGIVVGRVEDLRDKELDELADRYERQVFPVLTPLAVGPGQPFPYISGLSLSLGVFVRDPESGEERFARVKVPELLPRFLEVGSRGIFLPLEHVIAHFLDWLFPKMEIVECAAFRVTRDADFAVSDEADDLLEAVELQLRRRRFGDSVRVEVADSMSEAMQDRLLSGLGADSQQFSPVTGLLDLADTIELARLDRPDLKDDPWLPVTQPRLAEIDAPAEFFDEIRRSDLLVHHPYESFATSFEAFVRGAAADPNVAGLKTTVYRTSDETPLVPALIEASEDGKQSVCLVELKARFDEHRNIEWSRALERAGVHVVYGFPNLKIHAKATLVVRREGEVLRRYAHVGTGNYHTINARSYEDFGLFTADPEIAADVADLFNYLTGFGRPQRFRKLLVAPWTLRSRLIDEIRAVAEAAVSRQEGPDPDQGERAHGPGDHRGALRRIAGRSRDRARHPQHLRAPGRRAGAQRQHSRPQRARPIPRAQSRLHLRSREDDDPSPRQPGPHAAQPRPSRRGARSGPGRKGPAADQCLVRRVALRQRAGLGAPPRRKLGAPAAREERARETRARRAHAQRSCTPATTRGAALTLTSEPTFTMGPHASSGP